MRVGIVGAGLFGCTAAIYAARAGHEVHLFERRPDIMECASAVNQFRLHRGYHYPRSPETGRQCRAGNLSFWREYARSVITPQERKSGNQIYAIAREGSKVTGEQYRSFMADQNLPYRVLPAAPLLNPAKVGEAFRVLESAIDIDTLRIEVKGKLKASGVILHLASNLYPIGFDQIIVACYSGTNAVLETLGRKPMPMQYEVVEKLVIRMPNEFRQTGIVVMDGPFCSLDPYGRTDLHLLGHVDHAIHASNTGTSPEIPDAIKPYLNAGVVRAPFRNRAWAMMEAAAEFIPAVAGAEHIGSMFTVRAVLPNVDATDERPTLVERLDDQVIRIFSGKLGTAVDAATEALFMMERQKEAA